MIMIWYVHSKHIFRFCLQKLENPIKFFSKSLTKHEFMSINRTDQAYFLNKTEKYLVLIIFFIFIKTEETFGTFFDVLIVC